MNNNGTDGPIFYWKPKRSPKRPLIRHNVGDRLAFELVMSIIKNRGLSLERYSGGTKRLLSVGSVLHFAAEGDVVWGSGINRKMDNSILAAKHLDVRAVRGPLTAETLKEVGITVPDVYGDPGILVSLVFPLKKDPQHDYLVVPHFREGRWRYLTHPTLSPAQAPAAFLQKLVRARRVISSSLHGIVLAESYGIPAVWLENQSGEHTFKYHDYYLGTGRKPPTPAKTVKEALKMEAPPVPTEAVKEQLLEAFPWDLWA